MAVLMVLGRQHVQQQEVPNQAHGILRMTIGVISKKIQHTDGIVTIIVRPLNVVMIVLQTPQNVARFLAPAISVFQTRVGQGNPVRLLHVDLDVRQILTVH